MELHEIESLEKEITKRENKILRYVLVIALVLCSAIVFLSL